MEFLVSFLVISQIISFILIFKKINPIAVKKKGIYLEPIPKKSGFDDRDLNEKHQMINDLIETIKLENWTCKFEDSSLSHEFFLISPDDSTQIKCRLYLDGETPSNIYSFRICTKSIQGVFLTLLVIDNPEFRDKIIPFLWTYIIDNRKLENEKINDSYKESMSDIKSRLKAVIRNNKLTQLDI